MNRAERRRMKRNLDRIGLSDVSSKQIIKNATVRDKFDIIPEGSKVMLNINNTEKGNPVRNKFVEENINKVFTVKYESRFGEKPIMVVFNENPYWIWCINELIVVE